MNLFLATKSLLSCQARAGLKSLFQKKLQDTETYNIYKANVLPGVENYMVVPENDTGDVIQFNAWQPGMMYGMGQGPSHDLQYSSYLGWGAPSRDEIKQTILDGIQASIDALCSMKAAPNQIRAQASAFGIVEIEATWTPDEICQ